MALEKVLHRQKLFLKYKSKLAAFGATEHWGLNGRSNYQWESRRTYSDLECVTPPHFSKRVRSRVLVIWKKKYFCFQINCSTQRKLLPNRIEIYYNAVLSDKRKMVSTQK
jgi:hypothetical protein